jgi:hypothetical protein
MLVAIVVVGIGLFIVGFSKDGPLPLITGGVIVGLGVASMHYMGMAAISMPDSMHYNIPLFLLSVVIAIVAGTAALWAGTQVRGIAATIGASLVMGVAVSGMHYMGMAAMRVQAGSMGAVSGSTAGSFLVPLLVGISLVTFALTLIVSLSPTEDEIAADALLQRRIETEFSGDRHISTSAGTPPGAGRTSGTDAWTFGTGRTSGTDAWTFGTPGTSGTSGTSGPYRDGASAPDPGTVPRNVPRGGLAWPRRPRVRSDADDQR